MYTVLVNLLFMRNSSYCCSAS